MDIQKAFAAAKRGQQWPAAEALGSAVEYPHRTVIFRQGDVMRTLFLVESGAVRLSIACAGGRDIESAIHASGTLLGISGALTDNRFKNTAVALAGC